MTEATHFSQCVHDQQRRLEAEDCDSIRCAQLISGGRRRIRPPCTGRRRIRPPCTVPRSRSPTMRCIRLVYPSIDVSMWKVECIVNIYRDKSVTLKGEGEDECVTFVYFCSPERICEI